MYNRHVKRVCICEDETLPVIIKINPCPGKTCPYARESTPSVITQASSDSIISYSESSDDDNIQTESIISEKVDSSTSTSEGKSSIGTEVFQDFRLVDCQAFEKGGKCVNDAECSTTASLHRNIHLKIKADKANQILCHHTKLTLEEHEMKIEQSIMRSQSHMVVRKSLESNDVDAFMNHASRVFVIHPVESQIKHG